MDYTTTFARGDSVEVSTNREFTDSMYGEIISVGNNAVNIRYTAEQEWGILRFCWHEDDPRMQDLGKLESAMDRNTDDASGEIHMGIFRLTRSQKTLNEAPARMLALSEKIDAMDAVIERLTRKVAALDPSGKARGRKVKSEEKAHAADLRKAVAIAGAAQ